MLIIGASAVLDLKHQLLLSPTGSALDYRLGLSRLVANEVEVHLHYLLACQMRCKLLEGKRMALTPRKTQKDTW